MIDEPLALLAEAFGQGLNLPILSAIGEEASDDPSVIAVAFAGPAETSAAVP